MENQIRKVRKIRIQLQGQTINFLCEKYQASTEYPNNEILLDANLYCLTSSRSKFNKAYLDAFIYGILFRDADVVGIGELPYQANKIPKKDLSKYPYDEFELNLSSLDKADEFARYKSDLVNKITPTKSKPEIKELMKSEFDLIDKPKEEAQVDETMKSIRPKTLKGIIKLIDPKLTDKSNISGDYVVFELDSPYIDFVSNGKDTKLMSEIREYYKSWMSIEVSEIKAKVPKYEVYPVSDPNLRLRFKNRIGLVGRRSDYSKVNPDDIEIMVSGGIHPLFDNPIDGGHVEVSDGKNSVPLMSNNLRWVTKGSPSNNGNSSSGSDSDQEHDGPGEHGPDGPGGIYYSFMALPPEGPDKSKEVHDMPDRPEIHEEPGRPDPDRPEIHEEPGRPHVGGQGGIPGEDSGGSSESNQDTPDKSEGVSGSYIKLGPGVLRSKLYGILDGVSQLAVSTPDGSAKYVKVDGLMPNLAVYSVKYSESSKTQFKFRFK